MASLQSVAEFLSGKIVEDRFQNEWLQIQNLYQRKLWHELSVMLLDVLKQSEFCHSYNLIELYHSLIQDLARRISPLSLAEMVYRITLHNCDSASISTIISKVREQVKDVPEADIICQIATVEVQLSQLPRTSGVASQSKVHEDLADLKRPLREIGEQLDKLDFVCISHSLYFDASSRFFKYAGMHNEFYRDALRYLGCVDLNSLSMSEKQERAFNLALAAVLGSTVYNFGELISHPVVQSLTGTPGEKVLHLLKAFNSGDSIVHSMLQEFSAELGLAVNEKELRLKASSMALMELALRTPASDRKLGFQTIAEFTGVTLKEVENLVMHAKSKGLVEASIDEVDQKVLITWVQPRVLNANQVADLQHHFISWKAKLAQLSAAVTAQAPELLADV